MALELLNHYRQDLSRLTLIPAGGGAFEVSVDGKLIYSKLSEGRFPDLKELKQLIG